MGNSIQNQEVICVRKIKPHEKYENMLASLAGKRLVSTLCMTRRPLNMIKGRTIVVNVRHTKEIAVRTDIEQMDDGKMRRQKRVIDSVLFVAPGTDALSQKWCFTVGVEVKVHKSDLYKDNKLHNYLGWTDLFFIGVPLKLLQDALNKAYDKPYIGVVCLDSGAVYKMPQTQEVSDRKRAELYAEAFHGHKDRIIDFFIEV